MSASPTNGIDPSGAVTELERHRHFASHVLESLREDYRLRADEAQHAFGLYLRRKAGWATPDQAAYEAYRWWTPTVEPSTVVAREAEQLAHAQQASETDPNRTQPGRAPSSTTNVNARRHHPESTQAGFAAAESALSRIRGQGQRQGFSAEHVERAHHLQQVLDESPSFDSITAEDSVQADRPHRSDLEPALRPDTVQPRSGWDDLIVLDAVFAGTTITVLRSPGGPGPSRYDFLCDSTGGRGEQAVIDAARIGMVASGDRTPNPARRAEYKSLGEQVRNHLVGLADAVAQSRESWHEQQAGRLQAAHAIPNAGIDPSRRTTQATLGPTR